MWALRLVFFLELEEIGDLNFGFLYCYNRLVGYLLLFKECLIIAYLSDYARDGDNAPKISKGIML